MMPLTEPTAIYNLQLTAVLYSVLLSWQSPEQLNGMLLYYTLHYRVNGSLQKPHITTNANFSITSLTPNTLVSDITVYATTGGGEGPVVMADNITTLDRPGRKDLAILYII